MNNVYSLDLQTLETQMAQPRNKLLTLVQPAQSAIGRVFTRQELESIRDLAEAHHVVVFSDEIFAEVAFDGHTVTPFVDIAPQNAITCTSLGKIFNLTGVNHANIIIRDDSLRSAFLKQRNTDHFGSIDPFFYCSVLAGYSPEGLQLGQGDERLCVEQLHADAGLLCPKPAPPAYLAAGGWLCDLD